DSYEGNRLDLNAGPFHVSDLTAPASLYAGGIAWGDGSNGSGTVTGGAGAFWVAGSHTYAQAGSYAVTVTLSGPNGYSTTAASTVLVASAPVGLWVTNSATTVGPSTGMVPV